MPSWMRAAPARPANSGRLHQQGDGRKEWPMMKPPWHCSETPGAGFDRGICGPPWALEAIGQHDRAAVTRTRQRRNRCWRVCAIMGQPVQVQRRRMEEMEQAIIVRRKAQAADQAGDTANRAQAQSRQDDHQPQEGGGAEQAGHGIGGARASQPEEVRAVWEGVGEKRSCAYPIAYISLTEY